MHAHPTNGIDEYQGMPMFAEVGPLTMDEDVFSSTQEYMNKPESERTFFVSIKRSNIQHLISKNIPIK